VSLRKPREPSRKTFCSRRKARSRQIANPRGGRGKGTFKSGFQGGVKLCKTAADVYEKAKAMLGQVLVTKQTGPDGRLVSKLLVAAAPNIKKELYLASCSTALLPAPS